MDAHLIQNGIDFLQEKYGVLSTDCLAEVNSCLQIAQFKKTEIIVESGVYANRLFFVLEGSVRAYYLKDGKEITDWFALEYEFICAISSFFLQIPSPHYISSIEPTTAMVITHEDMDRLCKRYHDFEHFSRLVTTQVMLQLQQRVVALQFETAHQKYTHLLEKYPMITNRIALGHIASYLGITLETLSRIRGDKRKNLT